MKRVVHIAKNHREARAWDIRQVVEMTPAERQKIAKKLKNKVYGTQSPDVKEYHSREADNFHK